MPRSVFGGVSVETTGAGRPDADNSLPYEHDLASCFPAGSAHGDRAAFAAALERCRPLLAALRSDSESDALPLLGLAKRRNEISALARLVSECRPGMRDLVVIGAGGSSLGGQALAAAATGRMGMHFCDNADACSFAHLLARLDLAHTLFLVISKSGSTAETLVQCLIAWEAAAAEDEAARRFLAICQPGDNPLRRFAARFGITVIDHDPALGGRYAALSPVGLLPAMFAGLDPAAVCAGAAAVMQRTLAAREPHQAPPAAGAALQAALAESGRAAISVMMPYDDRLAPFAAWYCQLWAESLGKDGKGTTPLAALGPRDQHSQLQLFLDGPADKLVTLVTVGGGGGARVAPALVAGDSRLAEFAGASLGSLVAAMASATADSLAAAGRPVRLMRIGAVDGRRLGALLMHFMLETVIAAGLLGVDAFDQPAVDDSKRRAHRALAAWTGGAP